MLKNVAGIEGGGDQAGGTVVQSMLSQSKAQEQTNSGRGEERKNHSRRAECGSGVWLRL